MGVDEDYLDDEMKKLEQEINAESANELNTKLNNIPIANVNQQQAYQNQQVQNKPV